MFSVCLLEFNVFKWVILLDITYLLLSAITRFTFNQDSDFNQNWLLTPNPIPTKINSKMKFHCATFNSCTLIFSPTICCGHTRNWPIRGRYLAKPRTLISYSAEGSKCYIVRLSTRDLVLRLYQDCAYCVLHRAPTSEEPPQVPKSKMIIITFLQ